MKVHEWTCTLCQASPYFFQTDSLGHRGTLLQVLFRDTVVNTFEEKFIKSGQSWTLLKKITGWDSKLYVNQMLPIHRNFPQGSMYNYTIEKKEQMFTPKVLCTRKNAWTLCLRLRLFLTVVFISLFPIICTISALPLYLSVLYIFRNRVHVLSTHFWMLIETVTWFKCLNGK